MHTLFGIKNCDTMKKARAWLDANAIDYIFHDYRVDGLERKRLNQWVKHSGWEALLNKRGTTYRKLPDELKNSLNQKSAIDVMLEQPAIIKRPVLTIGDNKDLEIVIGFSVETYADILLD